MNVREDKMTYHFVWSFTPITIFYENFLFVNYRRFSQSCEGFSPESEKQNKTKQNKKPNTESMDRSWKFQGAVSQKLERTWLFMWRNYLGMFT